MMKTTTKLELSKKENKKRFNNNFKKIQNKIKMITKPAYLLSIENHQQHWDK